MMKRVLLLSIKPEYSNLIFDGTKKIELRKSSPNVVRGDLALIYNTNPDKAIVGFCIIERLIKKCPKTIWEKHSAKLGIDRHKYNKYYTGKNIAIGIEFSEVIKFPESIPLDFIKKDDPTFTPPQTYKYLSIDSLDFLNSKNSLFIFMEYYKSISY